MSSRRRRALLLVLLAVAASMTVVFIVGGPKVFSSLPSIPAWVLCTAPALMFLAWFANAGRVAILLHANGRRIGIVRAWLIAAGGDFGAALGPSNVTALAAYIFLLGRTGLDSARSSALFMLEKVLDQMMFAVALITSAVVLVLNGRGAGHWTLFEVGLGLSLGVLAFALLALVQFRRVVGSILWLLARLGLPRRQRRRIARWSFSFRRGVIAVASLPWRHLALLAFCAAMYWAPRFAILPLVAAGLHADVPWAYLLAVQVLTIFAGQFSLLPGGTITVEAISAALLLPWVDRHLVGLMLLLWRASVFYFTLLIGCAGFLGATAWRSPCPRIEASAPHPA
ncbi:MAG TPA: lysylphosphatidylglycerol synthase transmembrane domain-containing protein [Gammaproteobacteria bacterium]|nr:lysylphosphatidylglycerol synthase transmembrane domain-containing protein [Gammaproteobacteria bacterium]